MILQPPPDRLVWLDGEFVAWKQATMHLSDHHYGVGVFEGVRAYRAGEETLVFRLRDHTARLFRSASILNIRIPDRFNRELMDEVQLELVRKNRLGDAYLRPFVFYGGITGLSPRTRGLSVHVSVMALDWRDDGAFQGRDTAALGIVLRTATFTRHHPNSLLSKAKANGNYMNGIVALQEAQATGADDVLLLDNNGFATETSGANLFAVRGRTLFTPPLESALDGVTRDTAIALATAAGWPVVERRMTRDELYVSDEVFVTGTATEVTPVREIDGRPIGAGTRGPITEKLQAAYAAHVRGLGEHRVEWVMRA